MIHPTGKALFADSQGRLWITPREVDRDGTTAYTLLRVNTELIDAFHHKYEAVQAAELQPRLPTDPDSSSSRPDVEKSASSIHTN